MMSRSENEKVYGEISTKFVEMNIFFYVVTLIQREAEEREPGNEVDTGTPPTAWRHSRHLCDIDVAWHYRPHKEIFSPFKMPPYV